MTRPGEEQRLSVSAAAGTIALLWNPSIGVIVPAAGILIALLLPSLARNFGQHPSEEEGLGAPVAAGD